MVLAKNLRESVKELLDSTCVIKSSEVIITGVKCSIQGISVDDVLYKDVGSLTNIVAIGYFAYDVYPNEGDLVIYEDESFRVMRVIKHYYQNKLIYVEARLGALT